MSKTAFDKIAEGLTEALAIARLSTHHRASHVFTLEIAGIDPMGDDYEDRLYEAGCNDAVIAVIDDTLFLDFDREAPSFNQAVTSASRDVERAGGKVVKVIQTPE